MPTDKYNCVDCDEFTDSYMVMDELWKQICQQSIIDMNEHDYLCLECLENRMDRRLILEDFPRLPINIPIRWGFTMAIKKYEKEIENASR